MSEHIDLAVLGQQLHAQLRPHFAPRQLGQSGLQFGESALGRAHEVTHLRIGGAQFGEDFLGGDAPIHHPDTLGFAEAALDRLDHPAQGCLVSGVARKHLIGQRQALGCDHQGHHHLDTVPAFVAAVAKPPGVFIVLGDIAFEVGRSQVVEQNLVRRTEQVAPALPQMPKQGLLVFEQQIKCPIQRVILHRPRIYLEQVRQSCSGEPMTM